MVLCWPGFLHNGPGAGGGSSDIHCRALPVGIHRITLTATFLTSPPLIITDFPYWHIFLITEFLRYTIQDIELPNCIKRMFLR